MLFSNLLVVLALTVAWPLVLLGLLAGAEWLERRTLVAEEVVPRRLRRMADKPPEVVEAIVLEETAHVVAEYWSATGRPAGPVRPPSPPAGDGDGETAPAPRDGRHARRWGAAPGGRGRHERR